MRTRRSCSVAACLVVAALLTAGCGGSTVSAGSGDPSTAAPTGSPSRSADAPEAAMVVMRTGGIAGVRDMVRIAADGSAILTSKAGRSGACSPSAKALAQLRKIDLATVQSARSEPPGMADGFSYSVRTSTGSASASEGDDDSRRAELLDAAAAVLGSCLASRSGSGSTSSPS